MVLYIVQLVTFILVCISCIVLIVFAIIKGLAKSKKFVEISLKHVLLKRCQGKPNQTFFLKLKDDSVITVKYLPKQHKD